LHQETICYCRKYGTGTAYAGCTFRQKEMAVFWVAAPCNLIEVYHRFRGTCCLHHQGDEFSSPWSWRHYRHLKRWETRTSLCGAASKKRAIFKDASCEDVESDIDVFLH
jgi:hypothetical protein